VNCTVNERPSLNAAIILSNGCSTRGLCVELPAHFVANGITDLKKTIGRNFMAKHSTLCNT
jgi:hypothetical protein